MATFCDMPKDISFFLKFERASSKRTDRTFPTLCLGKCHLIDYIDVSKKTMGYMFPYAHDKEDTAIICFN